MANEEKIVIVERLLEAKNITVKEALKLLETEKEYIYSGWPTTVPYTYTKPIPNSWEITCNQQ